MTDYKLSTLINRIADGDVDQLEKIYYEMKDRIYAFVYIHVQNKQNAEDVLQETMLQLIISAKNFKKNENPKAWILTIARNQAISTCAPLSFIL